MLQLAILALVDLDIFYCQTVSHQYPTASGVHQTKELGLKCDVLELRHWFLSIYKKHKMLLNNEYKWFRMILRTSDIISEHSRVL